MKTYVFLISNFCRVLYVVCFLLGNSPASEFYIPNVILHLPAYEDGTDSVPKRRHIKFRRREITQKKTYNKTYVHL
jgi:gamma-glutamylcysteine synthetase